MAGGSAGPQGRADPPAGRRTVRAAAAPCEHRL